MRRYIVWANAILVLALRFASVDAADRGVQSFAGYIGNYRLSDGSLVGVDPFIMDDGASTLLFSDYSTGVVRRLFPASPAEFVVGAGFNTAEPVEITIRFQLDERQNATGMVLRTADGALRQAERLSLRREEVAFNGIDARLVGTLIVPPTNGPHPAIILLHGSGPLTRNSFGPYPHFFTSLGLAVLIFDKRGVGESTGVRTDASTGAAMTSARYPDELAGDALAAMSFLQRRADIDPERIGFWGSSEGGMLAMQVAARSRDVAFAINSSGFMEPLWETLRYQVGAILRMNGAAETAIEKQAAFVDLWLRVARTGEGWEDFRTAEQKIVQSEGYWMFQTRGPFTSLDQLRWDWDHILTFDPTVALAQVRCPVLGVFGASDPATPAERTVGNMRRVLEKARHEDFTLKIFPNAGHSLAVLPSGGRMAPGVFETLRSWLELRVHAGGMLEGRP